MAGQKFPQGGLGLVVVFYTKPFIEGVGKGLAPYVSVELDRPDGSHHQWEAKADAADFHAATGKCDVTIGPNTFRNVEWGEPLKYRIHVEEGPLLLDIDLVGQVRPWRLGTGYMYFGEQDEIFSRGCRPCRRGALWLTLSWTVFRRP